MTTKLDPKTLTYNFVYETSQDYGIAEAWDLDPSMIQLEPRIIAEAENLRRWGNDVASRYLEFQIKQLTKPVRGCAKAKTQSAVINHTAIDLALEAILHPQAIPMRVEDIRLKIGDRGLGIGMIALRQKLNLWVEIGALIKRPNPWRGNTWVYSHPDWVATPQAGDTVVQLTKRHQKKGVRGTVLGWELLKHRKTMAPIVQFERHYGITKEFADPHSLIIVDRPIKAL